MGGSIGLYAMMSRRAFDWMPCKLYPTRIPLPRDSEAAEFMAVPKTSPHQPQVTQIGLLPTNDEQEPP